MTLILPTSIPTLNNEEAVTAALAEAQTSGIEQAEDDLCQYYLESQAATGQAAADTLRNDADTLELQAEERIDKDQSDLNGFLLDQARACKAGVEIAVTTWQREPLQ